MILAFDDVHYVFILEFCKNRHDICKLLIFRCLFGFFLWFQLMCGCLIRCGRYFGRGYADFLTKGKSSSGWLSSQDTLTALCHCCHLLISRPSWRSRTSRRDISHFIDNLVSWFNSSNPKVLNFYKFFS